MEILTADKAAAFESNNVADLYHYQDVRDASLAPALRHDVMQATGMFSSVLKHPEYAVKSMESGDMFIVFQDENEKALLVNKHGAVSLFMREQSVAELTVWLTAFVKQYLRKYNPNNLACFPALPAAKPARRAKKSKTKSGS